MLSYLGRKLAQMLPVVFFVTVIVFSLTNLLPGDPTVTILGEQATPEQRAAVRVEYGLDQPAPIRYVTWLARVAQGEFGPSLRTREDVGAMLAARIPVTLQLGFLSILIAVVCLFSAEHWDFARLFTFHNYSGQPTLAADGSLTGDPVWPAVSNAWVFALGLLLPIYTITGYDASAHTSEETIKAASSVPRAMVMSVVWSALFGYLFLAAFVLMIPNMDDAAKQGWNVFFWAMDTQVNSTIKDILYLAILVCQWLCGLATVTSVSRMIFAFSRDGGLPASRALAKVSPTYRTPVAAIWTGSILAVLFVWGSSLVSIGETPVYTIVVSCTVIFLFFSFAIPIGLGLFAWGTKKWDKMGPWNLGEGMFKLFAVLTILAMILIFVLGIQPPNEWALYITVGFLVLSGVIWFGFESRRFRGPPIGDEVARRQAEIAAAEKAVGQG